MYSHTQGTLISNAMNTEYNKAKQNDAQQKARVCSRRYISQ